MKYARVLLAWLLLHIVALTLRMFRLKFWARVLARLPMARRSAPAQHADAVRWGRAVLRAESLSVFRRRWHVNCLPRSITICVLLTMAGIPCVLRIGVRLEGESRLESHAWVEAFGRPVAERGSLARLTPMHTVFDGARREMPLDARPLDERL